MNDDGSVSKMVLDEKKVAAHKAKLEAQEAKVAAKLLKAEEKQLSDEEKELRAHDENVRRVSAKLAEAGAKKAEKEEEMKLKEDEKRKKIRDVKDVEKEIFRSLDVEEYKSLVSDCYTELDSSTQIACQGINSGYVTIGRGGIGKTFRIYNRCKEMCGAENVAYLDSFTTPASLYIFLYENREKRVIILDDVSGLFEQKKCSSCYSSSS
jgi:uncharacterized protein (DUF885 family)